MLQGEERLQQAEREQNTYLKLGMSKGDEAKSSHLPFDWILVFVMALDLPGELFMHI